MIDELAKSQKLTAKHARKVAKNAIPSSKTLCEHCGFLANFAVKKYFLQDHHD